MFRSLDRYRSALFRYVDPGWKHVVMYSAGRFRPVQRAASAYYQLTRRHSPVNATTSRLQRADVSVTVRQLREHGIAEGLQLEPGTLSELLAYCERSPCFGNGQRRFPFLYVDRTKAEEAHAVLFSTGRYLGAVNHCSALEGLSTDPTLVEIAGRYLGAEPALTSARIWWSFAGESNSLQMMGDGQLFHFDLNDYRAISFFFYLSDVDTGSGPHQVVRGSHRRKPFTFLLSPYKSKSDEQIRLAYGPERIQTIVGKAGTSFAEDLFCYHKGAHPVNKDRLLLQIRFGYRKYGKTREE